MTRRLLIPISLIFCFFTKAFSQTPVAVTTETPVAAVAGFSSIACPPGVTPFAGTVNLALAPTAQTNDIEFLCINDVLNIDHLGGQTFGDPDPTSIPGISYAIYTCAPTETGPDFATVQMDPCLLNNPPPPANSFYVAPSTTGNGDAVFTNTGFLQTNFNGGNPFELIFAPLTMDDFATNGFETDGMGGPVGPCINANISEAFRVVFLNEIEATNINTAAQGSCTGSFTVLGGLPEFDNSNYTNFTITSNTNPGVNGMLVTATNYSHGDNVLFSVPEPGTYTITIEDGKSCAGSFTVNMNNCILVETTAGDEVTGLGQNVCVPITAVGFNNILNFQYIIEFDPTILIFDAVNLVSLPDVLQSGNPSAGTITISWLDETFAGQTFGPSDILYEVCFTAIGPLGSSSDIVFTGDATTPVEFVDSDGFAVGSSFNNGSVTISNSAFTISFGVCTSLTGAMDGSFTVIPNGGTPPYNIGWVMQGNPGVNGTATIPNGLVSNLNPGTYNVVVTDANGGVVPGSVVIPNLAPLFVQTIPSNPTCPNASDGSIAANFGDGIAPYTIVWNTGAMGVSTLNNLPAGNYSVSITDGLGCVVSSANSLQTPQNFTINLINQQNITCLTLGTNSGSLTVSAVGGNLPATYNWSNGGTTATISNLAAGSYMVTATDQNGCNAIASYSITQPVAPMIQSFDSVSVACQNQMTGSLTVNATPGSVPIISYEWNDPNNQTSQTATMLAAGTYTVTVTDDEGCTTQGTASLFAPAPLNVGMTINQNSCSNIDDGQIILTVSGGTEPISYEWSNGSTFNLILGLACGEDNPYSVTITDACETIVIDTFIPCPAAVIASLSPLPIPRVSCFNGPCDAQQQAFGSGGSGTSGLYTFNWSSGEVFANVSNCTAMNLCQGQQWVIVSDAFCSSDTAFFNVEAPSALSFDLSPTATFGTQVSCFGLSDGSYTVAGSGGTPGYTYQWANPATNGATISDVPAGNYIVTMTDANGCELVSGFQVVQPALFEVFIDSMQSFNTVTCAGGEDGQIAVYTLGGNPGLNTYNWAPGISANTSLVTGLSAGTYSVTVTDPKGCQDDILFTIGEPDPIMAVIADIVEPLCNGDQTVVTIDTVYGGSGLAYRFSVDFGPPQFPTSFIPILAGEHTVQVFDEADCFIEFTINVGEPAPVVVDLGEDIELELGDSVQLKPIIIVQDVPIDTLFWDPLYNLNCFNTANDTICQRPWVMPLETTTYELMVIDTNGCTGRDEIIVKIDRNRNVYIPNAFSPNGDGINDILKVYTGLGVSEINYFRIFDRWGEQVYGRDRFLPGDNDLEGWDGRMDGKTMNSGVYVFIAEVVFIDGRVLLYRGDISLIY
jgi:gliding motility-associated-like protein